MLKIAKLFLFVAVVVGMVGLLGLLGIDPANLGTQISNAAEQMAQQNANYNPFVAGGAMLVVLGLFLAAILYLFFRK